MAKINNYLSKKLWFCLAILKTSLKKDIKLHRYMTEKNFWLNNKYIKIKQN